MSFGPSRIRSGLRSAPRCVDRVRSSCSEVGTTPDSLSYAGPRVRGIEQSQRASHVYFSDNSAGDSWLALPGVGWFIERRNRVRRRFARRPSRLGIAGWMEIRQRGKIGRDSQSNGWDLLRIRFDVGGRPLAKRSKGRSVAARQARTVRDISLRRSRCFDSPGNYRMRLATASRHGEMPRPTATVWLHPLSAINAIPRT
jgi:hypothetical protein